MAEHKRDWYGKKGKDGKGKDGDGESKGPESMSDRHARERAEAHGRHAKAREDMNKSHEEELAAMAARHGEEAEGAVGNEPAPAAGPMPTAQNTQPTQGGAALAPQA